MRLVFALVLGMVLVPAPALAHEGHDDPEPVVIEDVSPRAEARSDLFEMLVVADDGRLMVYLDNFAGNEPVTGADIEILADDEFELVTELAPGAYMVPWDPGPGSYELTFIVLAGDVDDLLILTIEMPDSEAEAEAGGGLIGMSWSSIAIILLLGALAIFVLGSPGRRQRVTAAAQAAANAVGSRLGRADASERPGRPRPKTGASPPAEASPTE